MKGKLPMKKKVILLVLTGCIFLMGGCTSNEKETAEKEEISAEEAELEKNYDALNEKYINIEELPVFDMEVEKEYTSGDRTLILDDSIENELEYMIYKHYYDIISADFESQMENIGGSESFRIANQNEEKNFNDGRYMKEYAIHKLSVVEPEEIKKSLNTTKETLLADIEECGLESYALVKAEISWKYNEAALEAGPQLPEGNYTRYYLLGDSKEEPEIKICQIYWDEFL